MNWKTLGIRTDNLKQCFIPYLIFTIFSSVALFVFFKISNAHVFLNSLWHNLYPNLLMLILIAFIQEFLFRSLLMGYLREKLNSPLLIIVINSLVFSLIHLIFPFKTVLIPGSFIAGLGFATMFYYYPNLFLITASHAFLNYLLVPLCITRLLSC